MQSDTIFQGILKKDPFKYPFNTFVGGKHGSIPMKSFLHIKIKIGTNKLLIVALALPFILKHSKFLNYPK